MFENTYGKEFRETEFKAAAKEFWERSLQAVTADIDAILERTRETFERLFETLTERQTQGMKEVGEITISLLHVSVWEGPARARIDVYDQDQTLGVLLYTENLDVSWLFTDWEHFFKQLLLLAEEKGVQRYVKGPAVRWMMGGEITKMAEYFCCICKYLFLEADQFQNYDRMKRNHPFFITAGEYQDWQRVLYAELPEADPFNPPDKFPLMWQKVKNRDFKGQIFSNLDLSKARFTKCRFIQCRFDHVNLNDVCFAQCTFRDVELKSGTMYGAAFLNCELTNVDFSDMKQRWIPPDGIGKVEDVFRDIQVENCRMTDVREDAQR